MSASSTVSGPDLSAGVAIADIPEGGSLLGHVGEDAIILVRKSEEIFAVSATCTHYSGPLAEGLVCGEEVHCPWHHARFNLRTGEASGPPALNPLSCYRVERKDGKAFVKDKLTTI